MLSRREKLLNRPWQLRRYNNHRKKVLCALPAIDFGPPKEHSHVTQKLKKLQNENERRAKIEEDNFKLLKKMGTLMQKSRVENTWKIPPPDFLHRVGIFYRTRSPTPNGTPQPADDDVTIKSRCSACSSNPISSTGTKIPEERVPWQPARPRLSRRGSSVVREPRSDFDRLPIAHPQSAPNKMTSEYKVRSRSVTSAITLPKEPESQKKIILKQNNFELAVHLPPYAEIEIVSGSEPVK